MHDAGRHASGKPGASSCSLLTQRPPSLKAALFCTSAIRTPLHWPRPSPSLACPSTAHLSLAPIMRMHPAATAGSVTQLPHLPVLRTEASTASASQGSSVRRSSTSQLTPSRSCTSLACGRYPARGGDLFALCEIKQGNGCFPAARCDVNMPLRQHEVAQLAAGLRSTCSPPARGVAGAGALRPQLVFGSAASVAQLLPAGSSPPAPAP